MGEDIESIIKATMAEAQTAPHTIRNLVPYVMTASDLLHSDIPDKEYLISTFIPKASFGMVFAQRGIGKSWFALGLAKAIATGADTFLGWQVHEKGDVLFIDGEMSLVDLKERAKLLFGNQEATNFHILPSEKLYRDGKPICLDLPKEHEAILQLLEHLEQQGRRAKLLVFDNLSTLRRSVNENDNSETEQLNSFFVKLRHLGYAVLVVHHTNKAGDQRGASILEVPMDYVIKLSPPDKNDAAFNEGACFNVIFTKTRNPLPKNRDFFCELAKQDNGTVDFVVNTSMTEVPHQVTLLRLIAEGHVRPSTRLFSEKLGFSLGKINKLTKALRAEAVLEPSGYSLTDRGMCTLHDWFPKNFDKPSEQRYLEYQNEIPF